jgi:hypothetical protein
VSDTNIPSHVDKIADHQRSAQERVFRLAARDHGLTLKAISLDTGIGYTTIQSYSKGQAVMSIASLFRLVGVIPDELLSLLLPDGRHIVRAPEEIDHDTLCDLATDYVETKMAAHKADSPMGPAIAPCEDTTLRSKAVKLKAVG